MKKYAFAAAWLLSLGLAVSACDDKKEGDKASDTKSGDKGAKKSGDKGGDDVKATCLKVCKKASECVPEIAKSLGAEVVSMLGKTEAAKQQADMEKKLKAEFGDCDKMCSGSGADKVGEKSHCLEKKDCRAFYDCKTKVFTPDAWTKHLLECAHKCRAEHPGQGDDYEKCFKSCSTMQK